MLRFVYVTGRSADKHSRAGARMQHAFRSPSLTESSPSLAAPEEWVLLCQFRDRSRRAISVLAYRLLKSPHDAIRELLGTPYYEVSLALKGFIDRGDVQPFMASSTSTAELDRVFRRPVVFAGLAPDDSLTGLGILQIVDITTRLTEPPAPRRRKSSAS